MSGVMIIGALLRAHAPLVQVVPEQWIKAGALPEDPALPAILIRTVSSVDHPFLKKGAVNLVTERIAVTVRAASYRDQRAIIRLIRSAAADKTGTIAGAAGVSVLTAGTGPDVRGPGNSFEQTQDFKVTFNEPT